MTVRTLSIPPFEIPGQTNPTVHVTIALVDENDRRLHGLVAADGQPIIDSMTVTVTDTIVTVQLWPQTDLAAIVEHGSGADPTYSYYLVTLEHKPTRFLHRFRTQIVDGGALSWAEFASGLPAPVPGGELSVLEHADLAGLDGDDHPQYQSQSDADARYTPLSHGAGIVSAAHVPAGGALGQVLGKASGSDHAFEWLNIDVNTIGENVPGTGNVWDDVNAYCFSGPFSDGQCRLPIGTNALVYVGHNGVVYRWFGPTEVCIGSGGAGGVYPHYVTGVDDWVATGTTDHSILDNRALADAHPQAAITDLVSDQTTQDSRIAALEPHPPRIDNPHAVTKSQVGLGNADDTADADKPISTATQTALDAKIGALIEDIAPALGADLNTRGKEILIQTDGDIPVGVIGQGIGVDGNMSYLAFLSAGGTFEQGNGAVQVDKAGLILHGSAVAVGSLVGSESRQVYCTAQGDLYGVLPPDPGWEVTDTDTGYYDLGSGTGVGPWIEMAGLVVTVPEDVADGARLNVFANIEVTNMSFSRFGEIEIGFGINGLSPASGQIAGVSAGYSGYIALSLATANHGGLIAGDTITIFARRYSGSHNQFHPVLDGSDDPHELIVSVLAQGAASYPQVTAQEIADGTEPGLRMFSPADIKAMIDAHK